MQEAEGVAALPENAERTRFLMPSPIGTIGMELIGPVAVRVLIDPPADQCGGFVPFQALEESEFLEELFGRVAEYFAGARRSLGVEWDLAPSGLSVFARRVLKETAKVPYGRTRTYRQIAAGAGRPDAYRQVLAALVDNPLPLLVPCHRVVTNKSGIGSFVGGRDRKRWLIEMEKDTVKRGDE